MNPAKVWYVTGASQGFGLSLVKKLLAAGYRVAATSRKLETLKQAVGPAAINNPAPAEISNSAPAAISNPAPSTPATHSAPSAGAGNFLPLAVDLADMDSIRRSVEETQLHFGSIDVLVNNAGYGMAGTLEETSEEDIRNIFEVNVMALLNVTKIVVPLMRNQRSGYILNMGSVAGFVGAPGWSIYSATKAAVAAFSEVLALDLREFGIRVTVVEPSGFRTGFLTENSLAFTEVSLDGYQAVKDTQKRYLAANGKQPGDPERAAEILIDMAENNAPPLHLLLGVDAYDRATHKVDRLKEEMIQWRRVTGSADFPSDSH